MNIEKLAHILLVCVIFISLFALNMAMEVKADHTDESDMVSRYFTESMGDHIKERISNLKSTVEEGGRNATESIPARYFDVPLSVEIQDHIFAVSKEYDIKPSIIIAIIQKESNFDPTVMGDGGNSYGLMQVQPRWHSDRMAKLGVTDLLDPCQNITVAVDYLAECIRLGDGSLDWALMAYNGGPSYANDLWARNEISYYAKIIQKWAREYTRQ